MITKKLFLGLTSAVALAGLVWSTSTAVPPTFVRPGKSIIANTESGTLPAHTSAACPDAIPLGYLCCAPCAFFEDFENLAHFSTAVGVPPGNIFGQGDPLDVFDRWTVSVTAGASSVSLVSTANPAGGSVQHLRMSYDPALVTSTTFGAVVSARVPASAVAIANNSMPVAPQTVSVDIALIDVNADGVRDSDFSVQPQAVSQGFLTSRTMFYYTGIIYVLDDTGGGCCTFVNMGSWDTSGAYQTLTVTTDPCNNTIHYDYGGGAATYDGVAGLYGGTINDQVLFFHDNYPGTDTYDVDNIRVTRDVTPCPDVCGDTIVGASEQCEPVAPGDANCPGRCDAITCQCTIPCGGGLPGNPCLACPVVNDVEYTEITTGGWFTWTASAPAYAFDTCGINIAGGGAYDSALSVWEGDCATGLVLIETNDDCDDNTYGYGLNADPLASCYAIGGIPSPFQSCLCVETVVGQNYYVSDDRADNGLGRRIHLLASKRASCDAIWGDFGACCDTNSQVSGPAGCTDNVAAADCTATDQTFTRNKSCGSAEVGPCDCVPDCSAFECGSDGCGGSCGTCDDGDVCNGLETCDANKQCVAGTDLVCDDLVFCNGLETCDRLLGCVGGTNPCPDPKTCDEANDVCVQPNPVIPTVSEWGLAIMSLLLLVGLKVYFGRREALA